MTDQTIRCMQFYSFGETYLVLTESVQAIVPLQNFECSTTKGWHVGMIQWDNHQIPVIELSFHLEPCEVFKHTHLMVLKCLGDVTAQYVATPIGQIARPVDVQANDLVFEGQAKDHLHPVKGTGLTGQIIDMGHLSKILRDHRTIE